MGEQEVVPSSSGGVQERGRRRKCARVVTRYDVTASRVASRPSRVAGVDPTLSFCGLHVSKRMDYHFTSNLLLTNFASFAVNSFHGVP